MADDGNGQKTKDTKETQKENLRKAGEGLVGFFLEVQNKFSLLETIHNGVNSIKEGIGTVKEGIKVVDGLREDVARIEHDVAGLRQDLKIRDETHSSEVRGRDVAYQEEIKARDEMVIGLVKAAKDEDAKQTASIDRNTEALCGLDEKVTGAAKEIKDEIITSEGRLAKGIEAVLQIADGAKKLTEELTATVRTGIAEIRGDSMGIKKKLMGMLDALGTVPEETSRLIFGELESRIAADRAEKRKQSPEAAAAEGVAPESEVHDASTPSGRTLQESKTSSGQQVESEVEPVPAQHGGDGVVDDEIPFNRDTTQTPVAGTIGTPEITEGPTSAGEPDKRAAANIHGQVAHEEGVPVERDDSAELTTHSANPDSDVRDVAAGVEALKSSVITTDNHTQALREIEELAKLVTRNTVASEFAITALEEIAICGNDGRAGKAIAELGKIMDNQETTMLVKESLIVVLRKLKDNDELSQEHIDRLIAIGEILDKHGVSE